MYATEIYDNIIQHVFLEQETIVQFVVTYWRTKIWVTQSLNSYSGQSYRVMQTFKICLWYHISGTQYYLIKLEAKWIIRMKKVSFIIVTSCWSKEELWNL